jgi:hypothetical protein
MSISFALLAIDSIYGVNKKSGLWFCFMLCSLARALGVLWVRGLGLGLAWELGG